MVSCLMGDSTALASAIVRCCPKKIGTKEHYLQVNNHMGKIMDKLLEKHPDSEQELKELFLGVQILNNEYILKSHPEFLSD